MATVPGVTHRFCGQCGHQLRTGAAFCTECGSPVAPQAQPQPPSPSYVAPAPAPRTPRRRGPWLAVLAALVVLVGGGTVAAVVITGDEQPDSPTRSGPGLRVQDALGIDRGTSLLTGPGEEWFLPADALVPGGTMGALHYEDGPNDRPEVLVFDEVAVVVASHYDEVEETSVGAIAGVDTATGEVRWRLDETEATPDCWSVGNDPLLLCKQADEAGLLLVDPGDGTVLATADLPLWGTGVDWTGDTLFVTYVVADSEPLELESVALSLPGLETLWRQPLDTSVLECCHGDIVVETDGDEVTTYWINALWRLDRRTGEVLEASSDNSEVEAVGGYVVETEWDEDVVNAETFVYDADGNTLMRVPGPAWHSQVGLQVIDGRVGIGDALWDVGTGAQVWRSDTLAADDLQPEWSRDRSHLLAQYPWAGDVPGATAVLDAATGRTLTVVPTGVDEAASVFSDDAFVAAENGGTLTVRSLEDGEVVWSRSTAEASSLDEYDGHFFSTEVTDSALVAVGKRGLLGYTEFGAAPGDDGTDPGATPEGGGTAYATDCGSEPELTPVEAVSANGGVTVTLTFTATCPGGQWLSSSAQVVRIATADATWASGTFDFSATPFWLPEGDGAALSLVFPYDTTYATADEIQEGIDTEVVHVDCERDPDAYVGPVPADPGHGADPGGLTTATGPGDDTVETEESALDALRRIAAADDPAVSEDLAGAWLPQLSSKVEGTADDGIVYTYEDILAEHLRLRARYPDVRLVNSSDWRSYRFGGFWVTVVGRTWPAWRPPLRWCATAGFDDGHCYAKLLRRERPWEGTSHYRAEL